MSLSQREPSTSKLVAIALVLAAWWSLVLPARAEAYIDPSAGGMLVQLLLAGTAGVAVLAKLMWSRIKRVFGVSTEQRATDGETSRPHDQV